MRPRAATGFLVHRVHRQDRRCGKGGDGEPSQGWDGLIEKRRDRRDRKEYREDAQFNCDRSEQEAIPRPAQSTGPFCCAPTCERVCRLPDHDRRERGTRSGGEGMTRRKTVSGTPPGSE